MAKQDGKTQAGTWIGFLLIMVWCLFPVAWIISLSFKSVGETSVGSAQFLPKDATFENYKALWDWPFIGADPTGVEKDFQQALINSFGISMIATVLSVILATLAALATVLWLLASIGFSIYVSTFGNYAKTYGVFAGIIVLLFWLWITSYAILLGAEINAEAEQQTAADTTRGPAQPLGERDAVKADTVPGDDPTASRD